MAKRARSREPLLEPDPVAHLLDLLYATVTDSSLWGAFIEHLRSVSGNAAAGLSVRKLGDNSHQQVWTGLPPSFEQAYLAEYYRSDPWFNVLDDHAPGSVFAGEHIVAASVYRKSDFYRGLCEPHGIGDLNGTYILGNAERRVTLGMMRHHDETGPFDRHVSLLRRLHPHLRRVVLLHEKQTALSERNTLLDRTLQDTPIAVLAIAPSFKIVYRNSVATRLLDEGSGLRETGGRLVAASSVAHQLLTTRVREVLSGLSDTGGHVFVHRAGRQPLLVILGALSHAAPHLLAAEPSLLLHVLDPEASISPDSVFLQRIFGLTAAEIRLIERLARGMTPREAASDLGIQYSTARTQLRQVLARTRTDRQSSLLRLITSLGFAARSR